VDNSNPVDNAQKIVVEVEKFSDTLAKKERWLVLNKTDLVDKEAVAELKVELRKALNWTGDIHEISALNREGCDDLCQKLMVSIENHRELMVEDEDYQVKQDALEAVMAFEIRRTIENSKSPKSADTEIGEEDWGL
jgi:GTP-binding protein